MTNVGACGLNFGEDADSGAKLVWRQSPKPEPEPPVCVRIRDPTTHSLPKFRTTPASDFRPTLPHPLLSDPPDDGKFEPRPDKAQAKHAFLATRANGAREPACQAAAAFFPHRARPRVYSVWGTGCCNVPGMCSALSTLKPASLKRPLHAASALAKSGGQGYSEGARRCGAAGRDGQLRRNSSRQCNHEEQIVQCDSA